MKVKDLKRILENAPDDAPVVVPGYDHSYQEVRAEVTTALEERRNQWTEDHGEDVTPESEYGKRVHVLLLT